MKVRAFTLVCLISGALAVPVPAEEAQLSQQVQTQQEVQAAAPASAMPQGFSSEGDEGDEWDPAMMMAGHDQMGHGEMGHGEMGNGQMNRPAGILAGNIDMDAFQQMVSHQVQQQVQAIEELVNQDSSDADGLMNALVDPMAHLDETLATGVSRLALPGLNIGGILGGSITAGTKKPAALALLTDLLRAVSTLLENLLTRGPIGGLLESLLGTVLGGVTGSVGGVLAGATGAGAGAAGDAASQIPALLASILGSVGTVLPGAGAGLVDLTGGGKP
ncbi:hypothetical protein C8A00DRAFT_33840 [Chaetomidium leptoderma]|uniref:Uncharacterized protein n=1 Tax=Chaetomidium leptoderma TaxID=669021 RepID=A0AAN6ZVE5_9PEZI|nr:hypothetical protein C8A00DRAFT_33840 [Chaetomidium leptoderma]